MTTTTKQFVPIPPQTDQGQTAFNKALFQHLSAGQTQTITVGTQKFTFEHGLLKAVASV